MIVSWRAWTSRHGLRLLAAAGAVGVLLLAWLVVPGLGGDRLVAAVTPGGADPLPVASGFAGMSQAPVAPEAAPEAMADATSPGAPATGSTAVTAATAGAGDMPVADPGGAGASPSSPPPPPGQPPDGPDATATAGIPRQGSGTYRLAAGGTAVMGTGDAVITYSVEVESDLPFDPAAAAARVDQVLGDPRSWIGLGRWQLQRVEVGADARIVVATPGTTDDLCYPLQTSATYSCRNGPFVVLNADRWAGGAESWGSDVDGYRGYLVNHEFGHFLGFSHAPCPAPGSPAPVMLQQTKGLDGCTANAWPTVTGG